jgi:hypothetical protein
MTVSDEVPQTERSPVSATHSQMTKLEHAALEYLKALEGYGSNKVVDEAIDNLKETAMLWAQGYIIAKMDQAQVEGRCNRCGEVTSKLEYGWCLSCDELRFPTEVEIPEHF